MSAPDDEPQDNAIGELTRLADGTLDPARAAELRAEADASPELAERLREQERAVAQIAEARDGVSAPLSLRARVEELRGTRRARRRAPCR